MDNTTESPYKNSTFLVWYDEGSYTQHRFLVQGEENAQEVVKKLNEKWGVEEDEDDFSTYEKWNYEPIDFKNPYLK